MATTVEKIAQVIETDVKPNIEAHGGGIELISFDESTGVLTVQLTGVCGGCPGAQATIRNMVEGVIQQTVPEVKQVVRA